MQEWLDNNDVLMLIVKTNIRVRITTYKNIFSKGYTESWSREIFIIDSVFKTNRWTYKTKNLNEEKIIIFMKNNYCCVNHKCVIIQNQTVILQVNSK